MRYLIVLISLFFAFGGWAQINIATYSLKVTMDFSASPNMPKDVADRIKQRLSKPQTFTLFFDKQQSIYKREEKLDAPQQGNRGMRVMRFGSGGNDITHTNLATREQTLQQEMFGKLFLVTKTLWTPKWNFTGETKQIGRYTAYEATYSYKQKPNQFRMSFGRRNNEDKEKEEPKEVEVTVSVWFTPDIPVSAGPDRFFGLPGLVLMVQDGKRIFVCTEVNMNTTEKIKLTPPKKGQKVTAEELAKIREEKTKEMRERFQNNSNRKGRNQIYIRR